MDALRAEFRQDRIELQRLLIDRFDKLDEKIDRNLAATTESISEVQSAAADAEARLTVVEDRQKVFGKGLWGLAITFLGAALSYAFSYLKP